MPDLQWSGTAQLDGADYPFFVPRMSATSTVAMTRIDPATLALHEKYGTFIFRTTYQVSEDGASLRMTVVSATSPAARATIVYNRR